MGQKGRRAVRTSVSPQRRGVSRNNHAISKRDRERLVKERRATKIADKRAKAAKRRDDQADTPPPADNTTAR